MPIDLSEEELAFTSFVRAGDVVCWGQAAAEPTALTTALMKVRAEIGGFKAFVGIGWTESSSPEFCDHVRYQSYCAAGKNRELAQHGLLDILPCHYSALATVLCQRVDVLLLHLPPAGTDGRYSLGLASEYLAPLILSARVVVAEVNDQLPFTFCDPMVNPEQIDVVVHTSRAIPLAQALVAGPVETSIGQRIAGRVEDGAVLQIGLGAIPDAVLQSLSGHRDLGVHSGLINDGIAKLIESGAINNSRKSIDTGVSVAGLIAGGERLLRLVDANPSVSLRQTSYIHSVDTLRRLQRFTAINSAIEVDLTGQINAEVGSGRYVGAVGGAIDFLRGAHLSERGLPIIALPSTAKTCNGTSSRIVSSLSGPVSTARSDAGIIVTEHGLVDLRGLSISARIKKIIGLAAPEFRDELAKEATSLK